jgi:hypothetical protein
LFAYWIATILLLITSPALHASTDPVCEDPTNNCAYVRQDGVNSGQDNTFTEIQAAINGGYTTIHVFPGIYGPITMNGNITVRSVDGPLMTMISGGPQRATAVTFPTPPTGSAAGRLVGFTVANGEYGIFVNTRAAATIQNCVVEGNHLDGIYAEWLDSGTKTALYLTSCVVQGNGRHGIHLLYPVSSGGPDPRAFESRLINCIVYNHLQGVGIEISSAYNNSIDTSTRELFTLSHCNVYTDPGQGLGNLDSRITNELAAYTSNVLSVAPAFVNSAAGVGSDVRLRSNSQMIDKGWDGTNEEMRDPDGTRNDIGAFGGPESRGYFVNPNDGPTVRNVTAPAVVRKGESIRIEATGAVR